MMPVPIEIKNKFLNAYAYQQYNKIFGKMNYWKKRFLLKRLKNLYNRRRSTRSGNRVCIWHYKDKVLDHTNLRACTYCRCTEVDKTEFACDYKHKTT